MKRILATICILYTGAAAFSQSAVSITNGNWTNPFTWNCSCVPVNGYSVTVNHTVTLNTSMFFNSGGIAIGASGALLQDNALNRDILISGGSFSNSGKANFRYFLITAGNGSNAGSFTLSAFSNSVSFSNSGSIYMDSMYVGGGFTNAPGSSINGDSLTTATSFTNDGKVNVTWATNTGYFRNNNYHSDFSFTNAGTYDNYDSLVLGGSIWNKGSFNNKTGAKLRITKNFHNTNSGAAVFHNSGNVATLDSWYNTDTIKGPASGYFSVADTSANTGVLNGNFTFCDATPPLNSPFIDLNTGSIAPGIIFCNPSMIDEHSRKEVFLYPNPASDRLILSGGPESAAHVQILNSVGKLVKETKVEGTEIDVSNLEPALYFLLITYNDKTYTARFLKQ